MNNIFLMHEKEKKEQVVSYMARDKEILFYMAFPVNAKLTSKSRFI